MIESILRLDLHDKRIVDLVSKDKNNLPNIHLLSAPEGVNGTYIEYRILSDSGNLYDEGDVRQCSAYIQVDIFTRGSYIELRDAIKTVLQEKGYIYPNIGGYATFYEKETKLHHCLLRFIKEY